jgi:uncharacterized protein Yka (UPF0111/DUF47 family)
MFNLLPKDTVFFDLFEGLSERAISTAEHIQRLAQEFPNMDTHIQRIRTEEHDADDLAHKALERLDSTFITPFDREDIHTLVGELDTIIDDVDALAKRLTLYRVTSMEPAFVKQTDVLVLSTKAVNEAVHRLRKSRKLNDLQDMLIEVHRLENVGDDNHHAAISALFDGTHDPLHVIKWKELYDYLENAIDGCEDVTHTLERIVLKNG